MPEVDTLHGVEYHVQRLSSAWSKRHGSPMTVRPIIFPRSFAVGTDTRKYTTCTLECQTPFINPERVVIEPGREHVHSFDRRRVENTLLDRFLGLLDGGELLVRARGKEILLVAGWFGFRINFGLEGIAVIIGTADFWELISRDTPGQSEDGEKSELMRSFLVPVQLTTPKARNLRRDQHLTVFLAFVGESDTILITDHSRLLRFHIMVLPRAFTEDDLNPTSKIWPRLWSSNHGPDWIFERERAQSQLKHWRDARLGSSAHSRNCFDNFFLRGGNSPEVLARMKAVATHMDSSPRWSQTVLSVLTSNQEVFNGYGEHTDNDLLHHLRLWPGMPILELCRSNVLFQRFEEALHVYATQFISQEYRSRCLSTPNADAAFAFNYKSDTNYVNQYVTVYRKCSVRLKRDQYNAFAKEGLFDSAHTLGRPYSWCDEDLITVEHKDVPVYMFKNAAVEPCYTVIRAKPPMHWYALQGPFLVEKNLLHAGMSTTIGPASFFLYKQNQFDPKKRGTPGLSHWKAWQASVRTSYRRFEDQG
uniref:Oligopeptide transporter OPT-like protein n=1 Tax=Ganoderma boninense TaxID=34458 RepID=A0A5K1K593_9APHY|nr:Oligopeptide transporter OPT-like protein [Ganoderma boninense]